MESGPKVSAPKCPATKSQGSFDKYDDHDLAAPSLPQHHNPGKQSGKQTSRRRPATAEKEFSASKKSTIASKKNAFRTHNSTQPPKILLSQGNTEEEVAGGENLGRKGPS
ncbi:Hypothetical predicted protein [Lecanosticta acicola]|uniref:Uncharacterized protein n=1 Tax=Lecanosticta acicola TaxID=111012 RepID=A0AAI8YYL4_9PEZI|nr:Hypothetical predicted protein [Lecanosticta acicola]